MKRLLVLLSLAFAITANAQIVTPNTDLFQLANQQIAGKTAKQIKDANELNYDRFVGLDVNSHLYTPLSIVNIDANKRKTLTSAQVQHVIDASEQNPVTSLHKYSKYDPDNKGIGFCFGRAMFADLYMSLAGVNRGNIKKAFVVGSMSRGAWGWHVTTIVQSKNARGQEIWLAADPVVGYPLEVKAWYRHWLAESDDQKLKLFITSAGKFGPSASSYNEQNKGAKFYNDYFKHMDKWLHDNISEVRIP